MLYYSGWYDIAIMEQTQTPNEPQEPKKSFWAKLFGGGKPASPTPPPVQRNDPAADASTSTSAFASDVQPETTIPPVPPADSAWNASPADASAEQAPANDAALPSPAETPVPPVPTWRDTPAGVAEPLAEVPTPPSDPMVTPVGPAESVSDGQTVVPLSTVETSASAPEEPSDRNNPQNESLAQDSQASDEEAQKGEDRPSITPPPAR